MGAEDNAKNPVEDLADNAKKTFGQADDDEDLKAAGQGDQIKTHSKDGKERTENLLDE
ncbi:hypothetical protein [Streptomyces sp. Je 1-369]|uniref:hypothetical protein n=1 Tax=Streptomyces sp. Je 1-369 TaxID=2966192 RepID=UPI002285E622|nr:hypothetical protein [Streptomyces sp. Je 1-369]WAL95957.1 hypothetical protein NOO62_16540 [Streptomyces sp. Je 1-369]